MSEKIYRMIERLAEMFPKQDYQSRLEQYIASRRPQSAGDVEIYERQFNQREAGGFLWNVYGMLWWIGQKFWLSIVETTNSLTAITDRSSPSLGSGASR